MDWHKVKELLRRVKLADEDLFWMPYDTDLRPHWKISPVTGEYEDFLGFTSGRSSNANRNTELPHCPPGFKSSLNSSLPLVETDHVPSGSEIFSGLNIDTDPDDTLKMISKPSFDEIDQLTSGIDHIKVVYCSDSTRTTDSLSLKSKQKKPEHWARNVNVNSLPLDYHTIVPNPLSFVHPFELDPFQKQAVYHMERGDSIFVAAHTSAGKTAVAEYAIGLCQKHLTKAIYTSPIKALSNQKFRDFRETFGGDEVGLLTGDVQINPEAPSCLIMTTEILRSMLYRDSEVIREVEWVIFDEVHYVNDAERGVVWEEVIIMLPSRVRLVLLSATTPNTFEFADWIGRTRTEIVHVISTLYRPVPLEHFLYFNKEMFKIVDGKRHWNEDNYKLAQTKYSSLKSARTPFIGGSVLVDLIYFLKNKKNLLPCVVFSFSRKKCEEFADCLQGIDLNDTSTDHSQVHLFFSLAIAKLSPEDRDLPQLHRMEEMLKRGIAVHHSGLLPLMKECVEILFSRGLVKVLFATETFAMGVNMPTRTVVFSALKKHDGTAFRLLYPGEYTQMAGRAGRRGKDPVGTVIILGGSDGGDLASSLMLQGLLLGQPTKLASQFRITYGMILGLLRFEALQVEEMLKRSFSENAAQKQRPEQREQIERVEQMIKESPMAQCDICSEARLAEIAELSVRVRNMGALLFKRLLGDYYLKLGHKYFDSGRLVIISGKFGGRPALILRSTGNVLSALTIPGEFSVVPFPIRLIEPVKGVNMLSLVEVTFDNVVFVTDMKLPNVPPQPSDRQLIDIKDRLSEYLLSINPDLCLLGELPLPEFKILEVDEVRLRRQALLADTELQFPISCNQFAHHFESYYQHATLISRLAEVRFSSSDSAMALLPEYHARVALLKHLGFVDKVSGGVLLKGRVACEIRTMENSLLLLVIELLFSGYFLKLKPEEIAALLSSLYFQEQIDIDDDELLSGLPDSLIDACYHTIDITEDLVSTQRSFNVQVVKEEVPIRLGLVPTVYYWSLGHPFSKVVNLTESVLEGTIVRCIVRLEEGLRELCHAAKIMGDLELAVKFEQAAVGVKRDICFASSLYL